MIRPYLILLASTLLLFSCQKDNSVDPPNPPPAGGGDSLLKDLLYVSGDNLDSARLKFVYDGNGKLARYLDYQNDDVGSPLELDLEVRYERHSSGRVEKVIVKGYLVPDGNDSVVVLVHYNGSQVDYTISEIKDALNPSIIKKDSAFFSYDGSGNVTRHQYKAGISYYRKDYTYSAAKNVTAIATSHGFNNTTWSDVETNDIEYDDKVNPLPFSGNIDELLVYDNFSTVLHSKNNVTKESRTYFGDPPIVFTTVFQYNSSGKPITGTISGDGDTGKLIFTY